MPLTDLKPQAVRRTPEELVKHMKSFKLTPKFSAGVWFFTPGGNRFHVPYGKERSIAERLEIAVTLKDYGLVGMEAHYPNEVNEDNLHIWQKFEKDSGIKLIAICPLIFRDQTFEFGSLSSPIKEKRKEAIELFKRALQLNKVMKTDFAICWPGIDGYENGFGIDFAAMRQRFVEGMAEAMDAVPGVRVAFEPKPYEPRGHILFGNTAEGMIMCHQVQDLLKNPENQKILAAGDAMVGLNPEIGHVLMAYEDLPYAYSWPLSEGRLVHVHLNSQPLGNYDQDLNVGTISPELLDGMMWILKMHSYQSWFGIDINPVRMPVETAIKNNIDAVKASIDRINDIDDESVIWAANNPDKARGWIEAYLLRARTTHPEKLAPLTPLTK
jgi:xylose isomerase